MPIPQFTPGEVLSALRLNMMVEVVNQLSEVMNSSAQPFEQVELSLNWGQDILWQWLFRYAPLHRYYKIKYIWNGRTSAAEIHGSINGVSAFDDNIGGADGEHEFTIDLQRTTNPFNLIPGRVYTFDVDAKRHDSNYLRILWLFNTNNASYAPTLIQ